MLAARRELKSKVTDEPLTVSVVHSSVAQLSDAAVKELNKLSSSDISIDISTYRAYFNYSIYQDLYISELELSVAQC